MRIKFSAQIVLTLALSACSCDPEPACGDGVLDPGEQCDDATLASGDGCDAACALEGGWTCTGSPSACSATCGDGRRVGSEPCDDGAELPGDGCNETCNVEPGWTCAAAGCNPTCGDGLIRGGEACDDGDLADSDGCRSRCEIEGGWMCSGEPSVCQLRCVPHACGIQDCGSVDDGCGTPIECGACTGWFPLPIRGSPTARRNAVLFYTGSEVIVWGGITPTGVVSEGYIFTPATAEWRRMTTTGGPPSTASSSALWTGSELIVWGGLSLMSNVNTLDGYRYSVAGDSWAKTSTIGAPSPRSNHSVVWTGDEMIVWGGQALAGPILGDGGRYDPAADAWRTMATSSVAAQVFHDAVWTGTDMFIDFGGVDSKLMRWNEANDSWSAAPPPIDAVTGRMLWTGSEIVQYGARKADPSQAGAIRFVPSSNQWRLVSDTGLPGHRLQFSMVWSGSEVIVYGGELRPFNDQLADGAAYDPALNRWRLLSTTRAPEARSMHGATWADDRMFIFGGWTGGPSADGASYVPEPR